MAIQITDVIQSPAFRGYTGSVGAGFVGSRGYVGSRGFTGSASTAEGPTGFTGSVGAGFTGSASNVIGFTGSKGDGYVNIPQNSKSAAYTLVLADQGEHILHPSADTTARTFTIPSNASVAFPIGTAVTFVNQNGAGTVTIAITTDTMRLAGLGTTGSRTLTANGIATAVKITSTEWLISGTNLS